jgi:hypothetical protein
MKTDLIVRPLQLPDLPRAILQASNDVCKKIEKKRERLKEIKQASD